MKNRKIILPGGAGLVGQNLVARLKGRGYENIVVIDKHKTNLAILKEVQPHVNTVLADLAEAGDWQNQFEDGDVVIMLQAQIGGNDYEEFERNNLDATKLVLETMKQHNIKQLVHISSSVVESVADDFYTRTKIAQEKMVLNSDFSCPILRPTLMFGWFDRKHLGWLAGFMSRVPVFPIPGNGQYMRQPLYGGDFSNIIISCIEDKKINGIFNISGHEKIDYIDMIKAIKYATKSRTWILKIPYKLFHYLLLVWGVFDKNPPFTTQQLAALTAKDEFEVIDWPSIFGVPYTSYVDALEETFNHPVYSKIEMEF